MLEVGGVRGQNYIVRDLWLRQNIGYSHNYWKAENVNPHHVRMYKLSPA